MSYFQRKWWNIIDIPFRLPESDSSLLLLIIYSPIGCGLLILRSIILSLLFIIRLILPDSTILQKLSNKLACIGLGISVSVENSKVDENVEAYISNNVSIFDHLAVSHAIGSISVSIMVCIY